MSHLRTTLLLIALIVATVACGGDTTVPSTDEGDDDTQNAAPAEDPEAAGSRLVDHDLGSTEVPATPERVVVLDTPHLDTALSLGVQPVGAVAVFADEGLPAYLGDRAEGIEVVGTIAEPDLEAIAALEPDLILSATVRHEGIYDRLAQIAPTVFTASSGTNWKEGFELVAAALGRQDEGQQALASYEDRVERLGDTLDAGSLLVAIVRFLPEQTRIYGPDTFSGRVLDDIGFLLPDLDYDEYSMAYISAEQVGLLEDADVIFTTTFGASEETTRDEVTTDLWDNLAAVRSGCEFGVEDDEWMIGIGLIGAEIILDDVERLIGKASCG